MVLQGGLGQSAVRGDGEAGTAGLPHTFHLQYRSNSGTLSYIRHARILALRLDAFDNHYFDSSHASQNTSSASDTVFLTLTATPLALSHAIIAIGGYQVASANVAGYASLARDGVTIEE